MLEVKVRDLQEHHFQVYLTAVIMVVGQDFVLAVDCVAVAVVPLT